MKQKPDYKARRRVIFFVALVGVAAYFIGKANGRAEIMENTVVEYGQPYYPGVFFGRCVRAPDGEYCAVDSKRGQ